MTRKDGSVIWPPGVSGLTSRGGKSLRRSTAAPEDTAAGGRAWESQSNRPFPKQASTEPRNPPTWYCSDSGGVIGRFPESANYPQNIQDETFWVLKDIESYGFGNPCYRETPIPGRARGGHRRGAAGARSLSRLAGSDVWHPTCHDWCTLPHRRDSMLMILMY